MPQKKIQTFRVCRPPASASSNDNLASSVLAIAAECVPSGPPVSGEPVCAICAQAAEANPGSHAEGHTEPWWLARGWESKLTLREATRDGGGSGPPDRHSAGKSKPATFLPLDVLERRLAHGTCVCDGGVRCSLLASTGQSECEVMRRWEPSRPARLADRDLDRHQLSRSNCQALREVLRVLPCNDFFHEAFESCR